MTQFADRFCSQPTARLRREEAQKDAFELARRLEAPLLVVSVAHAALPASATAAYGYSNVVAELTRGRAQAGRGAPRLDRRGRRGGGRALLDGRRRRPRRRRDLPRRRASYDAQLIVVGSHGWGAARRLLSGSVSTGLVHSAPCPVLVVRPRARRASTRRPHERRRRAATDATDVILRDGSTLRLRPPVAEDADALLEFFSGLSEHSRYLRFHGFPALGPKLVEPVLDPDWQERGALARLARRPHRRRSRTGSGCATRAPRRSRSRSATTSRAAGSGRACSSSSPRGPPRPGSRSSSPRCCRRTRRCSASSATPASTSTRVAEGGEVEIRFPIAPTERLPRAGRRARPRRGARLARAVLPAALGRSRRRLEAARLDRRRALPQHPRRRTSPARSIPSTATATPSPASTATARSARSPRTSTSPSSACRASRCSTAAEEALAAGVRALVVISAGFAETGSEGAERQEQLLALVREHGARLLGPNCLGIASSAVHLNATFAPRSFPAGKIGFSSQSGALGLALLERGGGDRPRRHLVRVGRQQGGRLVERPARVVGGRRRDRDGRPLPRVVRQPARVLPHRAAARAPQADPRAEGRQRRARAAAPPARTPRRSPARTSPSTRSSARRASSARGRSTS